MDDADLRALIAEAQDGNVRSFELLVASYLPQVRRFARAYVASEADADDLSQEAIVKAYKNLRSFRFQASFTTWLFAVVRNVFIDASRSRAGKERSLEDPLAPSHDRAGSDAPGADEELAREEERQRVWRALRQLPVEFRSAVVLFDIEGHTYEEVAAIEEVAIGTVKSRLSRGRTQLRALLEGEPDETAAPGTSARTISSETSSREETP